MPQSVRARIVADGVRLLGQQTEPHDAVGEAEVGKQTNRIAAAGRQIDAGRANAVLLRQLAGGDGGPDGLRRRRMQGRQVHHGARHRESVRSSASRPSAGRGRDELERTGVDGDDRDARRAAPRGVASSGRPPAERRAARAPRPRSAIGAATDAKANDRRGTPPTAGREPIVVAATAPPAQRARRRRRARPLRASRRGRFRLEHEREASAGSTTSAARRRPPPPAPSHDSTPTLIHAGENSSRASSWRKHEDRVEDGREVHGVEQADRGGKRDELSAGTERQPRDSAAARARARSTSPARRRRRELLSILR